MAISPQYANSASRELPFRKVLEVEYAEFTGSSHNGSEASLMGERKRGHEELLHRRGNYLVRRLRLAPGEATPWHRDPFERVSVVVSGDHLEIEFRDGSQTQPWIITPGEVNWLERSDQVHRAVNVGTKVFEEVTTFFLDRPDAIPQPEAEEG